MGKKILLPGRRGGEEGSGRASSPGNNVETANIILTVDL